MGPGLYVEIAEGGEEEQLDGGWEGGEEVGADRCVGGEGRGDQEAGREPGRGAVEGRDHGRGAEVAGAGEGGEQGEGEGGEQGRGAGAGEAGERGEHVREGLVGVAVVVGVEKDDVRLRRETADGKQQEKAECFHKAVTSARLWCAGERICLQAELRFLFERNSLHKIRGHYPNRGHENSGTDDERQCRQPARREHPAGVPAGFKQALHANAQA